MKKFYYKQFTEILDSQFKYMKICFDLIGALPEGKIYIIDYFCIFPETQHVQEIMDCLLNMVNNHHDHSDNSMAPFNVCSSKKLCTAFCILHVVVTSQQDYL